jgi:hypothetical protein
MEYETFLEKFKKTIIAESKLNAQGGRSKK